MTKRSQYVGNDTDRDFALSSLWCSATVVAQSRLGICSDRRVGTDPCDRHHSRSHRSHLSFGSLRKTSVARRAGPSAAKAGPENDAFIAAVKPLRHPKP